MQYFQIYLLAICNRASGQDLIFDTYYSVWPRDVIVGTTEILDYSQRTLFKYSM